MSAHSNSERKGSFELTYQTEKSKDTSEYLHHKNLDEQIWICRVCECGSGPCDAYTDAAQEIAEADGESAPEEGIAGEIVGWGVEGNSGYCVQFGRVDNAYDLRWFNEFNRIWESWLEGKGAYDTVDGDDFAEDDAVESVNNNA